MAQQFERLKAALADRYAVERKLGEGGMATVYLARDLKHDRKVAVKVLRPELVAVIGTERFLQEIRVTANLQHPHIVQLYDSGEAEGVLYYVMPFVEGESLREKLSRENQLSIEEAVAITRAVADALDYAHRRNVIHRDIKPENILLQEGAPLVADFGIALAVSRVAGERLTETGLSLGTPSYMSPEQATGDRELDARSDVYALGSVLYEMLAGDPPFMGSNIQAVIAKVIGERPVRLSTVRDTVPANIEAAVNKALAKVPADRFASAKAFAEALVTETPVAPVEEAPLPSAAVRWRRRLGYVVPGAAALVLAWVLFGRGGDSSGRDATPTTIRPLTRFVGLEDTPTWSPDGSMIAYVQIEGGSANIATMSTGGGEPHMLTDGAADEIVPRWSPDGSKIAFAADRGAGTVVYWIPPTGGAERKLVETDIPFLERFWAWFGVLGANPWSPDGQELLFSRLHEGGDVAVWKVNLETGEETQLTNPPPGAEDIAAAWSNDGEQIAFARNRRGRQSIWLLPGSGGESTLLLGDEHTNQFPAWLPGNRRLVFTSDRSGALLLWEIELRSGRLRQLTAGTGYDYGAVATQSGAIAYTQFRHQVDIHWLELDAIEEQHERLTSFTGDYFGARVSPDGGKVVYHSDRTGNYELWVVDRESVEHRMLTDNPATDAMPDWSPDGSEIVFISDRGGEAQLWVVDSEGGIPRLLTDHALVWTDPSSAPPTGGPRWSRDGSVVSYVAATEQGDAIWLVEADGSDARASTVVGVLSFDWYLDRHRVVYTRRATDGSGQVELRAAHLVTGEDVLLLAGTPAEVTASPDGRSLAFVRSVSHYTMDLHLLRLEPPRSPNGLPARIGEPQQLTFGEGRWHAHNGGWAPDGSAIVYSRDADFGDIYVIEPAR